MTPEEVTRARGRTYAIGGAGIAALYMAFQYATTPAKEGVTPLYVPLGFAAIGIVCIVYAALKTLSLSGEKSAPATTDLSSPKGKTVVWLMVAGFAALIATWFVGFITPDKEMPGLAITGVLLLIVGVCFITAGRIARQIRAQAAQQKK